MIWEIHCTASKAYSEWLELAIAKETITLLIIKRIYDILKNVEPGHFPGRICPIQVIGRLSLVNAFRMGNIVPLLCIDSLIVILYGLDDYSLLKF